LVLVNTVLLKGGGSIRVCLKGRYSLSIYHKKSAKYIVLPDAHGPSPLQARLQKWVDRGDSMGYGSYSTDRLKLVFSIKKRIIRKSRPRRFPSRRMGDVVAFFVSPGNRRMGSQRFDGPAAALFERRVNQK
jgi:hypothetical protein